MSSQSWHIKFTHQIEDANCCETLLDRYPSWALLWSAVKRNKKNPAALDCWVLQEVCSKNPTTEQIPFSRWNKNPKHLRHLSSMLTRPCHLRGFAAVLFFPGFQPKHRKGMTKAETIYATIWTWLSCATMAKRECSLELLWLWCRKNRLNLHGK